MADLLFACVKKQEKLAENLEFDVRFNIGEWEDDFDEVMKIVDSRNKR